MTILGASCKGSVREGPSPLPIDGKGYLGSPFVPVFASELVEETTVDISDRSSNIGGESPSVSWLGAVVFSRPAGMNSERVSPNDSEKWLDRAYLGEEESSGFKDELSASDGARDSRSCKVNQSVLSVPSCKAAIELAGLTGDPWCGLPALSGFKNNSGSSCGVETVCFNQS